MRYIGEISKYFHFPYEGMFGGGTPTYVKEITGTRYVDLTDAVQGRLLSLKAFGGCEQADTPTPTTPVDIVCNNGALKIKDKELPVGYVRLASIEFAGSTYYDTDEKLYGSDTISMKISGNQATGMNCFGAYTGTGTGNYNYSLYVYFHNSNQCYLRYGDTLYRPVLGTGTKTITFGPGATTGFSSNVNITADTFESIDVAYIGALPNSSSAKFNGTFYGNIEVSDSNGTRLKWIPCKRKSDGVIGYYEVVNGNFLEPVGDTPTAGAEDYSNIEVYVDGTTETIKLHTSNTANMYDVNPNTIKIGYGLITTAGANQGNEFASQNNFCFKEYIPVEAGESYMFYGRKQDNTLSAYNRIFWYNSSKACLGYATYTVNTIGVGTAPSGTAYAKVSCSILNNTAAVSREQISEYNFMFAKGTTEIAYQPYYDGGTATCEDLLGVGDYKDEQEILSGDVITKVGVAVLTGEESFGSSSAYGQSLYIQSWAGTVGAVKGGLISCSHFLGTTQPGGTGAIDTCFTNTTGHLYFRTSETAADFKQFLADQLSAGTPVIVVYPLATPTTLSVAGQSLSIPAGDSRIEIVEGSILDLPLYAKYLSTTE